MAEVICMPKLGFNMDEGQLVRWCKNIGEEVKKGEVLFEINTDKTTMSIESTQDGVLLKTMLDESEFAEVFTPIAVVGAKDEDANQALRAHEGGSQIKEEQVRMETAVTVEEKIPVAGGTVHELKLTPKAMKLVSEEGFDIESLKSVNGTGYQGGITAKDIKASPLAKKLAEKTGVNLNTVTGSGIGGKVMKDDVKKAEVQLPASSLEKQILSSKPYKGIRKIIGDRLAESKFTSPHLYFTDSVDTTNMTAFRKQMNEVSERKITVSDILVYAVGKALTKYSDVNSSLMDEAIVTYKSVNVGVAVAGENGLIVPVIKNVQEKTLTKVSEENRDLVDRAKVGQLLQEEYSGGTFTISNLGMFGIENFTAIINPPESAILSVSSVRKVPVVIEEDGEEKIVIRPVMNIQLSVDHRLIDGLLAVQFIAYIKELLENPLKILL